MPKDKTPSKPKAQKAKTPKPKTKRKSLTKSKSKDGNSIASLFKLPDAMELKRGPLLRVNFPKVDESEDDDDPIDVPQDPHELKRLYKPFPKLQAFDPETGEDSFGGPIQVLDYIQIRAGEVGGQSVEDTEQWFGQILYIGARNISKGKDSEGKEITEPDVCLRVAWFYDYDMLGQRPITSEDKKSCSNMIKHELIFSDHHDTIHLSSVQGLIDIVYFDEMRSSIEPFQYGDRFYRRVLFGDRIISPKPTCTTRCKLTYHPERDIQHYCPRLGCKRWYHTKCLDPNKTRAEDFRILEYEQPPSEDRQITELMTVLAPEGNDPGLLKPLKDKDKFGDVGASSETETDTLGSPVPPSGAAQRRSALARQLPNQLRALATSAITRGVKSGQGITGGGWVVGYARTLARKVVFEGGVLSGQDEDELEEAAKTHNGKEEFKITPLSYFCPGCSHPI